MHGPHSVFDIGHCVVIHCDGGGMSQVDQWKAEKNWSSCNWPITRCILKPIKVSMIIDHWTKTGLINQHWQAMQFEHHGCFNSTFQFQNSKFLTIVSLGEQKIVIKKPLIWYEKYMTSVTPWILECWLKAWFVFSYFISVFFFNPIALRTAKTP